MKKVLNKNRNKHPRSARRGWFVLKEQWTVLFREFGVLTKETFLFLLNSLKAFILPVTLQKAWNKKIKLLKTKAKKVSKSIKKSRWLKKPMLQKYQGLLLMIAGVIAINLWLDHWWDKNQEARVNREASLRNQLAEVKVADQPHPTHIYIQWFVDAPIEDGTLTGNNWTLSETKAVYLTQSARPDTPGNIIIYGHNTRALMGNIRALKGGEKIKLTLSDGSERWYQTSEMHQVTPETMTYMAPTDSEVLTLYTCAGFADKDRFIVRAVPME